jgi:hypothetical protein
MKTEYQYIRMEKIRDLPKTSVWEVQNKSGEYSIGIIKWNPGWRQYCLFPDATTVFSIGCLKDICDFINEFKGTREK